MDKIKFIQPALYQIPLPEILHDAKHGAHTHFELITITIETEQGVIGTGYTYTGGRGGQAILAMLKHDLMPFIESKDADDISVLYKKMQWHLHYVGRGGIASFPISAVDIALWDIKGIKAAQPLWKMAGGNDKTCKLLQLGGDRASKFHTASARWLSEFLGRLTETSSSFNRSQNTSIKISI